MDDKPEWQIFELENDGKSEILRLVIHDSKVDSELQQHDQHRWCQVARSAPSYTIAVTKLVPLTGLQKQ